jgi:hypothetical protein
LLQMNDDIRQHFDDETDQIIAAFETLNHSDSENNSEFYDRIHECREQFFRDLSHPSDDTCSKDSDSPMDDLLENTDTDDGAEDIMDLLNSNRTLTGLLSQHTQDIASLRDMDVKALIDSNTQMVAFISQQRHTIARLRARITRLGDLLSRKEHPNTPDNDTKGTSSSFNPGPDTANIGRG